MDIKVDNYRKVQLSNLNNSISVESMDPTEDLAMLINVAVSVLKEMEK